MEKVVIPKRGSYANRFNLRTLELGEFYDVMEKEYDTKWARTVAAALRYYESDQKGKKFVQRKHPHPTKKQSFIIRIYRSE